MTVPALTKPRRARALRSAGRTLDNGLHVLAVRKPGIPLVEVRLRVPFLGTGATHPARAEVLAEAVLTGAGGYDRAGLAAAVQALGGDLNVGVDADRLLFSGHALSTNLRPLLELVNTVLTDPTYPTGEVNSERDRLVEKLAIARSQAGVVAAEARVAQMWGDHPYARELPTADTVAGVTTAQLRKLHSDRVSPHGATLVLVGDISPARVLDTVAAVLGGWSGAARGRRGPALPSPEPTPLLILDRPGSVQSSLRLGTAAVTRVDETYPALQLANLIFGGYFSSRWTKNIREDKGYTYGPHSRIDHRVLGSSLFFDVEVAAEVTAPSVVETRYELGRIASLPVEADEVEAARQYAIGTLAISLSTQAGLASTLSSLAGFGLGLEWLAEHPKRLATVEADAVSAAAAEWFAPARMSQVIVGPAELITDSLAALGPVRTNA